MEYVSHLRELRATGEGETATHPLEERRLHAGAQVPDRSDFGGVPFLCTVRVPHQSERPRDRSQRQGGEGFAESRQKPRVRGEKETHVARATSRLHPPARTSNAFSGSDRPCPSHRSVLIRILTTASSSASLAACGAGLHLLEVVVLVRRRFGDRADRSGLPASPAGSTSGRGSCRRRFAGPVSEAIDLVAAARLRFLAGPSSAFACLAVSTGSTAFTWPGRIVLGPEGSTSGEGDLSSVRSARTRGRFVRFASFVSDSVLVGVATDSASGDLFLFGSVAELASGCAATAESSRRRSGARPRWVVVGGGRASALGSVATDFEATAGESAAVAAGIVDCIMSAARGAARPFRGGAVATAVAEADASFGAGGAFWADSAPVFVGSGRGTVASLTSSPSSRRCRGRRLGSPVPSFPRRPTELAAVFVPSAPALEAEAETEVDEAVAVVVSGGGCSRRPRRCESSFGPESARTLNEAQALLSTQIRFGTSISTKKKRGSSL